MALNTKYNGYVGFLKQAALGTPAVSTQFVKFLADVDMDPSQTIATYPVGGGGFYNSKAAKELHEHNGKFSLEMEPQVGAMLFAYALGADAKSGAGPYTHVLTPARPLPYVTFERGLKTDILAERIQDCKVNHLAIAGDAGKRVTLDVDFMGCRAVLQASTLSDTYETDRAFVFMDGTFTIFGGAFTRIQSFKLDLNNNCKAEQTVEVYPSYITDGELAVTLNFEIIYDSADTNIADIFYGGGTTAAEAVATGAITMDFVYGTGADEREFKFEIPSGGLVYQGITTAAPGPKPDTLKQTISCDVIKVSGSELITVTFEDNNDVDYV